MADHHHPPSLITTTTNTTTTTTVAAVVPPTSFHQDSAVQTDDSLFFNGRRRRRWSSDALLLCDAATQTLDVVDYAVSMMTTMSDAMSILGGMASSLNNGTTSSMTTDPSNGSSMITVINQADLRPMTKRKSSELAETDVGDDDDDDDADDKMTTDANGRFPVIHSRAESQGTHSRLQPVGTLPQGLFDISYV
jgi:hypothetical protein